MAGVEIKLERGGRKKFLKKKKLFCKGNSLYPGSMMNNLSIFSLISIIKHPVTT